MVRESSLYTPDLRYHNIPLSLEYDLLLEECLVLLIDYLVLSLYSLDVLLMFGASDHKLSLNRVLPLFDVTEELLQIEFHLHSPVNFFHSFGH